jgi:hypothetical protein
MVSVDGATWVLTSNVCIVRAYSPTWASACVWCNYANGGGVGFYVIFEYLWETNACFLIVCSFYNVSQFPTMHQCKWAQASLLVAFPTTHVGNDKHQEWKSKNACQVVMLDGSTTNRAKRMHKTHWISTQRTYGIWWYEWGVVNQYGKHWWYLMMQSLTKLKKEDKIVTPKASTPRKLMIAYLWCMMSGDVLNLFLLCINNHN